VYRAKLRKEMIGAADDEDALSTSVAIKVLHPRVRRTVRRDIAIMSIFAKAFNALPGMEWLSLPEEVQVFGEMMNSQLDLRVEASNLDRFDTNFRKRGRQVVFPRAIRVGGEESPDVLIEEYIDALPLKWFLRNGGGPYDDRIANIGLDAFLVGERICVHADDRKCCFWTTGPTAICIRRPTSQNRLTVGETSWCGSTGQTRATSSGRCLSASPRNPRSLLAQV
jgi:predicted unusual protein kinase regulating ubiquinone biosynthesis (AarF/ABC1/UbiB family)